MDPEQALEVTKHAAALADALTREDFTGWSLDQSRAVKAEADSWQTRYVVSERPRGAGGHYVRVCVDYRTGYHSPATHISVRLVWPRDKEGKVHCPYHPTCTQEIRVSRAKAPEIMAREIRRRLFNAKTLAVWARCCDEADGASAFVAEEQATVARLVEETGGRAVKDRGAIYHTSPLLRKVEVQGASVIISTSTLPAELAIRVIRMIQEHEQAQASPEHTPDNWGKWDTAANTLGTKSTTEQ